MLLPRRTYAPLLGRLLHDRTADRIARVISRIPQAAATIVPYDVQSRLRAAFPDLPEERLTEAFERLLNRMAGGQTRELNEHYLPEPPSDARPIASIFPGQFAAVEGRLADLTTEPHRNHERLIGELADQSGTLTVRFSGPRPDIEPGQQLRLCGQVHLDRNGADGLVMTDPECDVVSQPTGDDPLDDPAPER